MNFFGQRTYSLPGVRGFKDNQPKGGQTTLELLIALSIILTSIAAGILVFFGGQSLSVSSELNDQATYIARQAVESARYEARLNFGSLVSASSVVAGFSRQTNVQTLDQYTKKVTVTVSWPVAPTGTRSIQFATDLTDWRGYVDLGGDTGGGGPSGNWKNPWTLGTVDLGPGNAATDLDVKSKIVYITAQASDVKKPDFFIVDATNGQSPRVVSSLNTGPSLNSVDVAGNYAYVANDDDDVPLQIIDVTNITSPLLAASFDPPGASEEGEAVFYYAGKVYLGTVAVAGPEFFVIDVSNPSNPMELGSFNVGADVNGIFISGNTAYLATSDDSKELLVLNVSNPSNITLLGSYSAPGGENGESIYVSGNIAYLGRSSGSNDFITLDVSSPAAPKQLGVVNLGGAGVNGIYVRDYLAFLATNDSNKEFQAWNISSSSAPVIWSAFNFPQVATGVDYEDNLVYVSVRSNDALRIVTSQ